MTERTIDRLQGTDGIRRAVSPASRIPADPLTAYLKHDVITEEFCELYCYAHVTDLIERGDMQPGDEVVIGWDSRDTGNFYTSMAVRGIAKAGGVPAVLGTLPTPGVALALVKRRAAGAFMITASHNPRDQNGIKIFLAPHGMKLLPGADRRLTQKVADTDYARVKDAPMFHDPLSIEEWGRGVFVSYHLDPLNSWADDGRELLSDIVLVVDAAHGAMAGLAADTFRALGFAGVTEVAGEQNGHVNENSGVAFLEGVATIEGSRLADEPKLAGHALVKAVFDEGRKRKDDLAGSRRLMGVCFDADGDRFFILSYDPVSDALDVLSGDETAALQAEYLMKTDPDRYRGTAYVHTVESDINAARHAASLGFAPEVTAVGDKWILRKAVAYGDRFGLGGEETGHSIHRGVVTDDTGEEQSVFAGNGLKGAVNTLVALAHLGRGLSPEAFARRAASPFDPGCKKSGYAYYIDKSLFVRDGEVWRGLMETVRATFEAHRPEELSLVEREIENEPEMMYLCFDRDGECVGTLFIRNSGTEDKIGVNARGPREMERFLVTMTQTAVAYLMKTMKDRAKSMADAEWRVLERVVRGETVSSDGFEEVNYDRLVYEMEVKQKLIKTVGHRFEPTDLGRELAG